KKLAVTVVIIAIILSNPNLNPPLKGGRGDVSIWLMVNSCGLGLNVQSSRFKVKKVGSNSSDYRNNLVESQFKSPFEGGQGGGKSMVNGYWWWIRVECGKLKDQVEKA